MFVKPRDMLMGALIKLLESSNWSVCGANTSLTKTPFQQNIQTLRIVISQGHSKRNGTHSTDLVRLLYGAVWCTVLRKHDQTQGYWRGRRALPFIFPAFSFV